MAHLTHVLGENTEAIYVDGRLLASADGALPVGAVLQLLVEQEVRVSSIEFHADVTVDDSNKFPEDVASLVTMLKVT